MTGAKKMINLRIGQRQLCKGFNWFF